MAFKLQEFSNGTINKIGNKFQFVVNGKSKGTYDSIDALIKAQTKKPKSDEK